MCLAKGRSGIARAARVYLTLGGAACLFISSTARADFFQGTLYFTTFSGGENVHSVGFSYNDSTHALNLGSITNIAATPGADGLVFTSDGFLAVGGQGNAVYKVNPNASDSFTGVNAGGTAAFHMMVAPNGTIYSSGIPGEPASYNSTLTVNGTPHPVSGPVTAIDSIAWAGSDSTHGFYTSSGSGGFGQFGTLDLTGNTLVASAPIAFNGSTTLPAAHGMTFDPYTGTLILSGDSHVTQIDPTTLKIVSDLNLSGQGFGFDQITTDGQGHVYVADNGGRLLFLDIRNSKLVGAPDFMTAPRLAPSLDDFAPLVGPGANPVPEPATLTLAVFGVLCLGGRACWRRCRKSMPV